jgi:hypothetical protein
MIDPTTVVDLFEFVLTKYQTPELGPAGEPPEPTALNELDALVENLPLYRDMSRPELVRVGIQHFIDFARQYLVDYPPQSQVMLPEGIGVQLAGGAVVSITPIMEDAALPGALEETPVYHVTEGRSIRGQGGVQSSKSIPVTGGK